MSETTITCLAIGDPHFKVNNVKETDAMHKAIIEQIKQRKPTFVVVLGDVLDRHESIHVSPLTRATAFLAEISSLVKTFLLIGNHDLKNNRQFLSNEHPFTALKSWTNMTVVDTAVSWNSFVFCPYVPPGRFVEALNTVGEWSTARAIFAHQEFKGCEMGAIISEEGDDWPVTSPLVISGHIHDYQQPQPNIIYCGTPFQHAFGDSSDKTVSFFSWDATYSHTHLSLHTRVSLGLRKKKIVRVICSEIDRCTVSPDYDIKIIISGTSAEIKAIMKHPNIEVWKKDGHKIVYKDIPNSNNKEIQPSTVKISKSYSTLLYETVQGDAQLLPLFNSIFGRAKPTITLVIKR
jgi:DNA repair exonuclease SbcCD nuclease subunit